MVKKQELNQIKRSITTIEKLYNEVPSSTPKDVNIPKSKKRLQLPKTKQNLKKIKQSIKQRSYHNKIELKSDKELILQDVNLKKKLDEVRRKRLSKLHKEEEEDTTDFLAKNLEVLSQNFIPKPKELKEIQDQVLNFEQLHAAKPIRKYKPKYLKK